MKLSKIKRDARLSAGAWVTNIPGFGDLALKVLPLGGPDAERTRRRGQNALPAIQRVTFVDPVDEAAIETDVLMAVLQDWANLEDDEGSPIPFSPGQAQSLLSDPATDEFRAAVRFAATVVERQGAVDLEASVKN